MAETISGTAARYQVTIQETALTRNFCTAPLSREHISEQNEIDGIVLVCRIYPRTDISVRVRGKMSKALTCKRYGFV